MGNLITSIPVNKPQTTVVKKQVQQTDSNVSLNNPYKQNQVYSYVDAKPLSPAVTTPRGISAQPSSGHIIKENIFQSMGSTVKSYADYVKYFYKAGFKGEGTDYSVGKINDLSIRAGSLGIATVLATTKLFPFAKGMEFVGLGTWFASMALWPKVLGAPIKAIYGVDMNQKYIDSYGRRKSVYDDNQYRLTDLFRHLDKNGKPLSEEEYKSKYDHDFVYLDKMGDKLGVPNNIENRNEATVNKMNQVAVQGKTLWMLTAGVMTPVVSSLVADAAQKPLKDFIEKSRYNKQEKLMTALEQKIDTASKSSKINDLDYLSKFFEVTPDAKLEKELHNILGKDGILDEQGFKNLHEFFDKHYYGTNFGEPIKTMLNEEWNVNEPVLKITEEFKQDLKSLTKNVVQDTIKSYSPKQIAMIPEEFKNYQGMSDEEINRLLSSKYRTNNANIDAFDISYITFKKFDKYEDGFRGLISKIDENLCIKRKEMFAKHVKYVAPKEKIEKLFKFVNLNLHLNKQIKAFEKATIKNIAESITANNWSETPQKYLKTLGFNDLELAKMATMSADKAAEVVSGRLTAISQDDKKFNEVIKKLSEYAKTAIGKEQKAVIKLLGTEQNPGTLVKLKNFMEQVAKVNIDTFPEAEANSHYSFASVVRRNFNMHTKDIQRKINNTIDSFTRPIKALDFFRNLRSNIASIIGADEKAYAQIVENDMAGTNQYHMFHNLSYAQAREKLSKYLKDMILQKNDINDWTTKFETSLGDTKRGFKNSKDIVSKFAKMIFGPLSSESVKAIGDNIFVNKTNVTNLTMGARFTRIENEILPFMTQRDYFNEHLNEFFKNPSGNESLYKQLIEIADNKRADLPIDVINNCKKILREFKNGVGPNYNIAEAKTFVYNNLKDAFSSSVSIAEMSGKNIVDFLSSAAQNQRARNKWTKTVYALLYSTLGLSALTIALMGKRNYFNQDKYEYKKPNQGAAK